MHKNMYFAIRLNINFGTLHHIFNFNYCTLPDKLNELTSVIAHTGGELINVLNYNINDFYIFYYKTRKTLLIHTKNTTVCKYTCTYLFTFYI